MFLIFRSTIRSISRGVYSEMKDRDSEIKTDINKLRNVEIDDKIIRLNKDINTNFTELGLAFNKGSVDIYEMDMKHPGLSRELRAKLKTMTNDLINETRNTDVSELEDDSEEDKDQIKRLINHWNHYKIVYDVIFPSKCRSYSTDNHYEECYEEYRDDYDDKELEHLRESISSNVIKNLERALDRADERKIMFEKINEELSSY